MNDETDAANRHPFGDDAEIRRLGSGDVLCAEGDHGTDVFQIVSGRFDAERATDEGPMVVAQLSPGELVGEVTNTMGGARSATLRATEDSTVAVYSQEQFGRWLDEHPERAEQIAAEALLRLNRTRAASVLIELFGFDNQDVVDAIVREIRWITLAPGDVLFEQGDVADAAYLLIAGRLHVQAVDDADDVTLDIEVGRGEIVGEMGIIDDAPRVAGARAIRESTLALISREAFDSLAAQYPTLLLRVFRMIVDRLTHRYVPEDRARVVGVAVTADEPDLPVDAIWEAVGQHGSTLHLGSANLGQYVRNVTGPGASTRIAEFIHEADVVHDYVVLQSDGELTPWSAKVAKQSDRFVLVCSAEPDAAERTLMHEHLDQLGADQRESAWIVRTHAAAASAPSGSRSFLDEFAVGEVHNVRADQRAHFARIGRLATGNGLGLVLGGGGARGLAHIGVLRALHEAGIEIDRVGGTSMGAVIGALVAQDISADEMLTFAETAFTNSLLDYTVPLVSLIKGEKMSEVAVERFTGLDITDLWIPYYCVSTNITTATKAVHRVGPIPTAVRASVAIPVVLPPVPIDGDLHVDGGVLDNVPVRSMRDDNSIGTVIAVDVSPPGGQSSDDDFGLSVSGFEVLRNRFRRRSPAPSHPEIGQTLLSSMLIGSSHAKNESTDDGVVDLYLDLDLTGVGLLKFEKHAEVVRRGYEASKPMIEAWLADEPSNPGETSIARDR